MPAKRILATLLHVTRTVIESARLEDGRLVVACRPRRGQEDLCPHCGRHRPVYDRSPSPRRWRALDLGATMAWIEYATLRVSCPEHGVVTAAVPWARPGSRFTEAFEDQVAWLCAHCGRSAVAELMRIDWKSVGGVCARVRERLEAASGDRLDGLARIGVDETSYKKGHKYMTVVVDHDTGRVAWCARGCGKEVLGAFFDLLGEERCAAVEVVTADGAGWIADVVEARCPNAERVMDPFHVVQWATDMLDSLRREAWGEARRAQAAARGAGRGRPPRPRPGPGPSRAAGTRSSRTPRT